MRKSALVLSLILLLAIVAVAYAQGPGWWGHGMMGPGMMGGEGYEGWYCPYCGQYMGPRGGYGPGPGIRGPGIMGPGYYQREECQKFLDETTPIRKELHMKRYEYSEVLRNPKTTSETIEKIEKEIRELQQKIHAKAPYGCRW